MIEAVMQWLRPSLQLHVVGQHLVTSCAASWPPEYAPAPADLDF